MIFVLPRWFFAVQELKQALAANFVADAFDKKSAAATRTNQSVDFLDQIPWQQDVCAYRIHTNSVPYGRTFL